MIAIIAAVPALCALVYTIIAFLALGRFHQMHAQPLATAPSVTILRPLYGAEPELAANLETLLAQNYPGPVEIICGVRDPDDPAVPIVRAVQARHPGAILRLIIDPRRWGANNKISNLHNMAQQAKGEIILISDSDVALPPGALDRLAAALAMPGVGLVTCFYAGRGHAGLWSKLAAMDMSYRFMPSVAVSVLTGLGHPALGPTMAFKRATFEAIGGFTRFTNIIAEDYAMGQAVRALGLKSAIPPLCIVHGCAETSARGVINHELRWTKTIYGVDPAGFMGSIFTHALPLSLIACAVHPPFWPLILAALGMRHALALRMDAIAGWSSGPKILLPMRDLFSFAIFLMTFFVNRVNWRGSRFTLAAKGRISAAQDIDL